MTVNKAKAMSMFLQFRSTLGKDISYSDNCIPRIYPVPENRKEIYNSEELYAEIKNYVHQHCENKKTALALSAGIDSAILAAFVPKDTIAYTFRCIVPGKQVVDESIRAKHIADINGLEHRIVDIYWEDYTELSTVIMQHKRSPIHSIEIQIYKAAEKVKSDGFDSFLFGETADIVFGGFSGLLSKSYTIGEFIDRYSFVLPYKVLKDYELVTEPFIQYADEDGYVDVHEFMNKNFFIETINSYINACSVAGVEFLTPFMYLKHSNLDIERVRGGENKYLVREVFKRLYPNLDLPPKTPMPRPVNEWFEHWDGPKRPEFWRNCHVNMTGDQRYYIWILERFLDKVNL